MDRILKKICSFLKSDDAELQCSAARILKELSPKSAEVRLSLAKNLSTPNLTVKNYILSALESMPGQEELPYLFPLLQEGPKVQERAIRIIASSGPSAVAKIKKRFKETKDEPDKIMLIRILGLIGTDDACRFLVDCIADARLELSKRICLALREAIGRMDRKRKRMLLKKLNTFLASPHTKANTSAVTAGVILLGYLADATTINKILRYTASDQPLPVRKHALITLSRLDIPRKSNAEVSKAIIPMLDESDYPNIVRNAIDVLKRINIPNKYAKHLKDALRNRHPAVRSFVLSRMDMSGTQENIGNLISHLNSGGYEERRAAQEALAKIPKAYPHIIKALDDAKDYEEGMRLISILSAQRDQLGLKDKRRLLAKMEKLLSTGDRRYSLYATALKAVDPDLLINKIMGRVKRLKSGKKFTAAEEMLRILTRQMLFTDEIKYELAVIRLRNSPKDLSPLRRKSDEVLMIIGELVKNNEFPLLKRLKSDKALRPQELFYLSFHFSEKLFDHRKFGVELLKYLVKKSPRSQIGSAAKEKLSLVGINV